VTKDIIIIIISVQELLSSTLLSKNIKILIYRTTVLPASV
jgi:hypothetical protein